MRLFRHIIIISLLYSTRIFSQNRLDYGQVPADKDFHCDTSQFRRDLYTDYKSSTHLKTICESENELEIRYYTTWAVLPGWTLYIISYDKGEWNAAKYWYNFGRKSFDSLHPVKILSLKADCGFDSLFKELKQNNIFTLPDAGTIQFEDDCTDPAYNLITYKVRDKFRSYRVAFPCDYQKKYPDIKTFEYYDRLLDVFVDRLKDTK